MHTRTHAHTVTHSRTLTCMNAHALTYRQIHMHTLIVTHTGMCAHRQLLEMCLKVVAEWVRPLLLTLPIPYPCSR